MKQIFYFSTMAIFLIHCGTSKYSLTEDKRLDPSMGIVAFQYELIDNEGKQFGPNRWWNYALFFLIGPTYIDIFIDRRRTNLGSYDEPYVVFQYPAGELPRDDSFQIEVRKFIFLSPARLARAYFTKTNEKVIVEPNSILVLPKIQINIDRNFYKTISDAQETKKVKEYVQNKYSHLLGGK